MYAVKEIFYTLQGEGAQAGRPAVFCRFAGCTLWTGRETDSAPAVSQFCDSDLVATDGEGCGKLLVSESFATQIDASWQLPHTTTNDWDFRSETSRVRKTLGS